MAGAAPTLTHRPQPRARALPLGVLGAVPFAYYRAQAGLEVAWASVAGDDVVMVTDGAQEQLRPSGAELGEANRARDWARRAILFDPDNMRMQYNIACAMAGLKDIDAACDFLDRVVPVVNAGWLAWMERDTSLDPIRNAPRFIALMEKAKVRGTAI